MHGSANLAGDRPQADLVLDAAHECLLRWGIAKTTIDDIAEASGISRATIYRLFPGGRDVLFEALRVREQNAFFTDVAAAVMPVIQDRSAHIDEVIARTVVAATQGMRTDESLLALIANEPGACTLEDLTMDGFPRIVRIARSMLTPVFRHYVQPATADRLIDVFARLTISYFLAPSDDLDLGDIDQARRFVSPIATALLVACEGGTITGAFDPHQNANAIPQDTTPARANPQGTS